MIKTYAKGRAFEEQIVREAKKCGLKARREILSGGGRQEKGSPDVWIEFPQHPDVQFGFQVKSKKGGWKRIYAEMNDGLIIRADRARPLIVLDLIWFFNTIRWGHGGKL